MKFSTLRLFLFSFLFFTTSGAVNAQLGFNFTFDDVENNTGFGFDDPVEGQTRRDTLTAVGNYIGTVIDDIGVVDIRIDNSVNNFVSVASASTFFFNEPGIVRGLVFQHGTTGVDPFATEVDGFAEFNFGLNWNSDLGAPASNEFDLFSIALHELTHALGFTSSIDSFGDSVLSSGGRTMFDTLLEDGSGNPLIGGPNGTDFVLDPSVLTSDDVFINVGNGERFKIDARAPFTPGTSIGHLDPFQPGSNVSISGGTTVFGRGDTRRVYDTGDLAVLSAIGWNLNTVAVPEPSSSTLLVFAAVGFFVRRRRFCG